jgi:hypothetical protein
MGCNSQFRKPIAFFINLSLTALTHSEKELKKLKTPKACIHHDPLSTGIYFPFAKKGREKGAYDHCSNCAAIPVPCIWPGAGK